MQPTLRLTQYSHGAGCGCKIAPQVLDTILATAGSQLPDSRLWVGNSSRDDAAVFEVTAPRPSAKAPRARLPTSQAATGA